MLSGALFKLSGEVSVNGSWQEDIYFTEAGQPMDISDLEWRLTFRKCQDDPRYSYGWGWSQQSPDYTLSTDDYLSVVADDDSYTRVLRISVPAGTFAPSGDYVCDLASKDANDTITPWAHGVVSFRNNPAPWA